MVSIRHIDRTLIHAASIRQPASPIATLRTYRIARSSVSAAKTCLTGLLDPHRARRIRLLHEPKHSTMSALPSKHLEYFSKLLPTEMAKCKHPRSPRRDLSPRIPPSHPEGLSPDR